MGIGKVYGFQKHLTKNKFHVPKKHEEFYFVVWGM